MDEEYVQEHILTGDIRGRRPDGKASRRIALQRIGNDAAFP
jgi:hypothetical protein